MMITAEVLHLWHSVAPGGKALASAGLLAASAPAPASADAAPYTDTPHTPMPEVQLLSNGRYHVMLSNAGGGYSRWGDIELTRWRADTTRDSWGSFCYVRDVESTGVLPTRARYITAAKAYTSVHGPCLPCAPHCSTGA